MKKCILSIMVVCVAIMSQAQLVLENEAALVYYMPKNEVVITLEYDVVEQTPGVFYRYAERYLGTKNVITEEQNSCYLTGIQTELTATADRQREYKITAAQGIQEQFIRLSEDGRLLGYGIEYDTKVPTACPADYSVGGNKVENIKYKGDGNFRIEIQEYKADMFMWVHNEGTATLMCPEDTDYNSKQAWLRKAITNIIYEEAKRSLPQRLEQLAQKHGFKYSNCSVRNSHSRWGSCSGRGNISLSIYLVLLTDELIDYVLLHELCHTIEMNHSERFWALLDKVCGSNSREIRQKLKKQTPDI